MELTLREAAKYQKEPGGPSKYENVIHLGMQPVGRVLVSAKLSV